MTASEFVGWVEKNAARVKEYSSGGDGSNGKCDCIGLIIGAWRMSGNSWPWVHGSNYTARYLTDGLGPDQQLRLGDLVYKARPPGEKGYDLPERYWDGPDMLDYYHVGVVTCEAPLQITHCTSVPGGIKRDTSRGSWKYSGQFSKVSYGGEMPVATMMVWSANGKPVNLRNSYSRAAAVIAQMKVGSIVEVLGYPADGWAKVKYGDKTGYCMTEFLQEDTTDKTAEAEAALTEARELIDKALSLLRRG